METSRQRKAVRRDHASRGKYFYNPPQPVTSEARIESSLTLKHCCLVNVGTSSPVIHLKGSWTSSNLSLGIRRPSPKDSRSSFSTLSKSYQLRYGMRSGGSPCQVHEWLHLLRIPQTQLGRLGLITADMSKPRGNILLRLGTGHKPTIGTREPIVRVMTENELLEYVSNKYGTDESQNPAFQALNSV